MELGNYLADENLLICLINKIFENQIKVDEKGFIKRFIKQGTNNIDKNGDLSIAVKPFNELLAHSFNDKIKNMHDYFDDKKNCLISKTEMSKVNLKIFMNRKNLLAALMPNFCCNVWRSSTLSKYTVNILTPLYSEKDTLTKHRCHLVSQHLKFILDMNGANVLLSTSQNDSTTTELENCSVHNTVLKCKVTESFNECKDSKQKVIVCSAVIHKSEGSKLLMCCEEYVRLMKEELKRASLHKGGITENDSWESYINNLANGCLNLQLMSVSHSSTLRVDLEKESQNSRDGAFILYNYARLCSLFKNFDSLVKEKVIPPLPPASDVNFTLLKHSEEWELFWLFVLRYPELIKEVGEEIINSFINDLNRPVCKIPIHSVTKFLHRLSHCLSAYYNRVHILPSHQDSSNIVSVHLLPILWARIYLLKAVHLIMLSCLDSLNVIPPSIM